MHLLMETAIGDSRQYRVLSPDELDALKKELAVTTSRIEATNRKLTLEIKLRDATQSVQRLYTPKGRDGGAQDASNEENTLRVSRRRESGDQIQDREQNVEGLSTKKCESLVEQLWKLDRKEQDIQKQLLEHTAGVLQHTHKGYLKKDPGPDDLDDAQRFVNEEFGDLSHYRPYSQITEPSAALERRLDSLASTGSTYYHQVIIDIENRIEELNARIRDMILEMRPRKEDLPDPPRQLDDDPSNLDRVVFDQVDFLGNCITTMHDLQKQQARREAQNLNQTIKQRLQNLNERVDEMTARNGDSERQDLPQVSESSLEDQVDHLEMAVGVVQRRIEQLSGISEDFSKELATWQSRAEQYASVVKELWAIIKNPSDDTVSEVEKKFPLQKFLERVQDLHANFMDLRQRYDMLTTEAQQLREVNESADVEKDSHLSSMRAELQAVEQQLATACSACKEHEDRCSFLTDELATARQKIELHEEQINMRHREAREAESAARVEAEEAAEQKLLKLVAELDETKSSLSVMEVNALTLRSDLEGKARAVTKTEATVKELESQIVRLQTELTFSKAEVDAAYGTRAERAAEMTPGPTIQKELETLMAQKSSLAAELKGLTALHASAMTNNQTLQSRVDTLQRELGDTIGDYEAMTKASIEFEKEREQLESLVDSLRDRIETLDGQLSDERVHMIGLRDHGHGGARESTVNGSTSTMVLKNEFKKMMRETRAEHEKAMRVRNEVILERSIQLKNLYRPSKRNVDGSKASSGHLGKIICSPNRGSIRLRTLDNGDMDSFDRICVCRILAESGQTINLWS